LVFLHGVGESGDGSEEQLGLLARAAIPGYIANDGWPDDRPFVVLAPQHEISGDLTPKYCDGASCDLRIQHDLGHPNPGSLCMTPDEVDTFLSYAIDAYDVDPKRVYLTGSSCGAFGAWEYLAEHGDDQVAAIVPIAGEGRPAWQTAGCSLGEVPLWAFHGETDDVVDPVGSIEPITQLQACTSSPPVDARLTTYPDVGHDSWTSTYAVGAENDIYAWMLGIRHP
jgi:predicted peptidase